MNGICFPFIQENEDKEEANFYCQCNPGFKGRNCESKFNELKMYVFKLFHKIGDTILIVASKPCFSNPCFNNGICVNVVDESDSNDFTCNYCNSKIYRLIS